MIISDRNLNGKKVLVFICAIQGKIYARLPQLLGEQSGEKAARNVKRQKL